MKIGDIAAYAKRGITPKYVETDGFAVVNQRCVKDGIINTDFIKYTSKDKKYSDEKKLRVGDILINSTGTGTLGRVAFVYDTSTISYVDSHVTILRCEEYNSKFLYYWLRPLENYIESLGKGSTNQIELSNDAIFSIDIPAVSIDVQCRIADILSAYDNLIENNQKQLKLLEEAVQRLYKEWFVDLRFPGYEDTPIVDGVPEGWSLRAISEFGEVVTGKTPSTEKKEYYGGNIPFVKIPDMHDCVYPVMTESSLTEAGAKTQIKKFIPRNSIMVSCIATVGLVNIAVERCQTNQQINSIILFDERNLYYVFSAMKRLKELLEGVGSNGATMTNVNKTKFASLPILYPSEELRDSYYSFCKPIFEKIYNLSLSVVRLKKARDRLLPKLMSGEIEV